MRIGAFGKGLIVTLGYIAAFVALVLLQFPSAGPVSLAAGGVSLRAIVDEEEGIRSLELQSTALRLVLSEGEVLEYLDQANKRHSARPLSFEQLQDGFSVRFDDGSTLTVRGEGQGSSWSLATPMPVISASLPFSAARGTKLLPPNDEGQLRIESAGKPYLIRGLAADASGRLAFQTDRGRVRPVSAGPEEARPAEQRLVAQAPMDPQAWQALLAAWQDKAWAWVSGDRLDAEGGSWRQAGGGLAFDEPSLIAFMSEAYRRGAFDRAASLAAAVRARSLDRVSWRSMPYVGRSAAAMAEFEEASLAATKEAERRLQARSPELFYEPGVIGLLFDRSPYALAQEAMAFAASADFSSAGPANTVRLLRAYLDAKAYLPDDRNPLARVTELADKVLSPAVRKAESGFYLVTGPDGQADTALNLEAGRVLVALGEAVGKPVYIGLGQSLVKTILDGAGPDGSAARSFTLRDGVAVPSGARLTAAELYPLAAVSPYLPRAASFFKELGPGVWAWTISPDLTLDVTAELVTFKAGFRVGYSHYLALYGIKPFSRIQLYGLNYNMDPGFENYNASGYFYKRAAGAMYVKLRHRDPVEEIRLFN